MVKVAEEVRRQLKEKGLSCTMINARFAVPFDKMAIRDLEEKHALLVTMEENVESGGFGEHIQSFIKTENLNLEMLSIALPNCYVEHGNVDILKKELRVDADAIVERILEKMK